MLSRAAKRHLAVTGAQAAPKATVQVFVDGKPVRVEAGTTVLRACEQVRIRVRKKSQNFKGWCPNPAILLPRATFNCRQLPYVLGRGGEDPQGRSLLRLPRHQGHAHFDQFGEVAPLPRGRHGVPLGQSPPRLPHL